MLRALVFVDSGDAFLCRVLDRWTGRRASKNTKAAATESSYAVTATCKSTGICIRLFFWPPMPAKR